MELDRKTMKMMFPKLGKEMETDGNKVQMDSIRSAESVTNAASHHTPHYTPDAIDFLRRCETTDQAEEIISYLEKRAEITRNYAAKLRTQLKSKGLRSFGSKKESEYYLKHGEPETNLSSSMRHQFT